MVHAPPGRRRTKRAPPRGVPREGVYAAIDLGTNNCRLLIARPAGGEGFEVVDSFSRIVRLGEGLNETGRIAEAAAERTLAALRICNAKIRQWGIPPERLRAVATAACRRAANGAEFLARAQAMTGIGFDVIGTEEEAELALLGCVPLLDRDHANALVIDIGGGSTELAWAQRDAAGRDWEIADLLCLPHGVVTLSEAHAGAGYRAMVDAMRPALEAFDRRLHINREVSVGAVQMLGTSGTVTTLAALHLDLPRYDRARVDGSFITFDQVRGVTDELVAQSMEERATHPCIGADRADLVVAGCAILQAICEQWPVGRLRVADRGLREGILLRLMAAV